MAKIIIQRDDGSHVATFADEGDVPIGTLLGSADFEEALAAARWDGVRRCLICGSKEHSTEAHRADEYDESQHALFLWLFAQHVHTIAREEVSPHNTQDNPVRLGFSYPASLRRFEVCLWHRGAYLDSVGPVWDQGSVDGVVCGNRSGVIKSYARAVWQARLEVVGRI